MPNLTRDQAAFREEVSAFARAEVAPQAGFADREHALAPGLLEKLAAKGYLGIPVPETYGGLGRDDVCYALAVEELSRACGSTGIIVAAHTSLGVFPIYRFGNEEQKRQFLPLLTREGKLGAFGLTEPGAGSDAGGLRTSFREEETVYVLNGGKCFITSGALACVVVVAANRNVALGVKGISNFLVSAGTPGFTIGRAEDKLGLNGSNTAELFFEDCRVAKDRLLGRQDEGFKQFMITLDGGRISIGAMSVGLGQAALDVAWEHLRSHPADLARAKRGQDVQIKLADMETRVAAARELVLDAARLKSQGAPFTTESAMAKLYASEVGTWAAYQAIQICGEAALLADHPANRIWRDAKLCEIGEGTSQVQRLVIFRQCLKRQEAE